MPINAAGASPSQGQPEIISRKELVRNGGFLVFHPAEARYWREKIELIVRRSIGNRDAG